MVRRAHPWRRNLRLFLAEHVDIPLVLDGVFVRFEGAIPLHHASRVWLGNHDEVGDPYRMRWRCFKVQLSALRVERDTRYFTRDTVIIPRTVPCVICGVPFFGLRATLAHGGTCQHAFNSARKRESFVQRKALAEAAE